MKIKRKGDRLFHAASDRKLGGVYMGTRLHWYHVVNHSGGELCSTPSFLSVISDESLLTPRAC